MKQYLIFFIIIILSICLYLLNYNCSTNIENFRSGAKYNINYNASKKFIYLISSSKVIGDKTGFWNFGKFIFKNTQKRVVNIHFLL